MPAIAGSIDITLQVVPNPKLVTNDNHHFNLDGNFHFQSVLIQK